MNSIKKGFKYIYKEVFRKPQESDEASSALVKMLWFMRITIFLFGFFQIFTGQALSGIMILLSVLLLIAPSFFSRSRITDIPLEIEFFLFLLVLFHFVVGEAQDFYGKISFYDNILHLFFPFLISIIGFTIVYALYKAGKLKISIGSMIFFVIIVTVGIGAVWEIIEYGIDELLLPHIDGLGRTQGTSPTNANHDTMTDLINDLVGGIIGAIVASKYLIEAKYNKRIRELLNEIAHHFFGMRKIKKNSNQKK